MPTPINAATRPMPAETTTAKLFRHRALTPTSQASVVVHPTRSVPVIDRPQRFGEYQYRRLAHQRRCDRQALPLPARQIGATLADPGRVAVRQLNDEFGRVGVLRPLLESRVGRLGLAEPQILFDR